MTGSDWALPQRIMMRLTGQPVHVRRAPYLAQQPRLEATLPSRDRWVGIRPATVDGLKHA